MEHAPGDFPVPRYLAKSARYTKSRYSTNCPERVQNMNKNEFGVFWLEAKVFGSKLSRESEFKKIQIWKFYILDAVLEPQVGIGTL